MVSWAAPDNVIGIDPQLIDPENGDYRVTPGSTAESYGCQVFPDNKNIHSEQNDVLRTAISTTSRRNSIEVTGIIDEDTFWNADTIRVIGDIEILDQAVLTIAPRTKIECDGFYSIDCKGCIQAIGEANGRISFTSTHPELFVPDSSLTGAWNGIRFHKTSYLNERSVFSYCDFKYSKTFSDSTKGGVFSCYNYSKVRIVNCSFTQNCADYGSVIGIDYQSCPEIIDCIFYKNYAFVGGSPIYCAYSYPHLINNTIIDNYVLNDDINYRTGAVQSFISKPYIINNIMRRNYSQYIVQGQITECKDYYTIYNNIECGHGGTGNIDEDPLFDYHAEYPYSLLQSSPCIDAGIPDTSNLFLPLFDYAGVERMYNGRIDMGALEWHGYAFDPVIPIAITFSTYPNPFKSSTCISYSTTRLLSDTPRQADLHELSQIKIYNIKGQLIKTITPFPNSCLGMYEATWNGKDKNGREVCDGVYVIKCVISDQSMFHKILKIN